MFCSFCSFVRKRYKKVSQCFGKREFLVCCIVLTALDGTLVTCRRQKSRQYDDDDDGDDRFDVLLPNDIRYTTNRCVVIAVIRAEKRGGTRVERIEYEDYEEEVDAACWLGLSCWAGRSPYLQ